VKTFDTNLLAKDLTAALSEEVKADRTPHAFTNGMRVGLMRALGVLGRHFALAHEHTARRLSTTDELLADLEQRLAALEQNDDTRT